MENGRWVTGYTIKIFRVCGIPEYIFHHVNFLLATDKSSGPNVHRYVHTIMHVAKLNGARSGSIAPMTVLVNSIANAKTFQKMTCQITQLMSRLCIILSRKQFLTCNHVTNRPCWWYGTKEYLISAIVGTSQRGRASLSGMSQEIGCHMVASQELLK